jgi:hypothetical protein
VGGRHPPPGSSNPYFFFFLAAFFFAIVGITSFVREMCCARATTLSYFFFFLAAFFFAMDPFTPLLSVADRAHRAIRWMRCQYPIASRRRCSACAAPRRS